MVISPSSRRYTPSGVQRVALKGLAAIPRHSDTSWLPSSSVPRPAMSGFAIVKGLGFGVGVAGSWCLVSGSGFRVQGSGFRVQGLGLSG